MPGMENQLVARVNVTVRLTLDELRQLDEIVHSYGARSRAAQLQEWIAAGLRAGPKRGKK